MKKITILKSKRTRLLNKKCKSIQEFEEIQNRLNEIEFYIKEMEAQ